MKIIQRSLLAFTLLSIGLTQTGCFGTFALTRKAYAFHDGLTESKFLKSLLFWIPGGIVYGVVGMLDVVIFNLIEFWSGSNPIAMSEGDHETQLVMLEGERYRIDATKDTFTTTQLSGTKAGEVRVMKFDRSDRTWKYTDSRVCEQPVLGFPDASGDNVRLYTHLGTMDLASSELEDRTVLIAKIEAHCNPALAKK